MDIFFVIVLEISIWIRKHQRPERICLLDSSVIVFEIKFNHGRRFRFSWCYNISEANRHEFILRYMILKIEIKCILVCLVCLVWNAECRLTLNIDLLEC